jgi:hypothetical protein
MDVIKPDCKPIFCHANPSKPIRCTPKSLLEVPDPDGCKISPTSPFDNLLIPSQIEVSLVLVMTSKVHVNVARTDQCFERAPDKPIFSIFRIARMQSREKSLCCNRLQASGCKKRQEEAQHSSAHTTHVAHIYQLLTELYYDPTYRLCRVSCLWPLLLVRPVRPCPSWGALSFDRDEHVATKEEREPPCKGFRS